MDLFAGQLHLSLGQADQAYSRFLHSVENYPLSYDSYSALVALVEAGIPVDDLNRGLVDYYAGQYGYALDAFTRYATSFPENDGTVYYYRALALRESGLYQEAVDSFAFFITNYSSNFYWKVACEDKADTQWFRLGQYEAAVETMMAFIHTTSDISAIPQALLDTGRIAERAGLLDQAAGLWISLADTYPESALVPQALFWAGIVQYRAGNYEQALLSFQRGSLFSLDPEDQVRAIFWTAKTKQNLGDSTASQALLQQAASMDQTDYYSLRAQDMLFNRSPFDLPRVYTFDTDLVAERLIADAWLRVTFGLPIDTDLSGLGELSLDARLLRGTELYNLDLAEEALFEFENLRNAISENAAASYRLGNYLLDLGLCTPAIFALRQVLTLAGMDQQSETLAAPRYFNLVRYGLYYQELILPLAQQTGFDPLFLFSVMRQESLYDKLAGSGQGALGLMQITPDTGQMIADNSGWPPSFETDDLYLPVVSIEMGASHLLDLRLRYNGELYTALAAYNAGPNAAPIWRDLSGPDPDLFLETIRYPETHAYIRSIYEIYSMYHYLYETVP
jgi:soluble lytic murein transglycosylase